MYNLDWPRQNGSYPTERRILELCQRNPLRTSRIGLCDFLQIALLDREPVAGSDGLMANDDQIVRLPQVAARFAFILIITKTAGVDQLY